LWHLVRDIIFILQLKRMHRLIKTKINAKEYSIVFNKDRTAVVAVDLIDIIWSDDKKYRDSMKRKVKRLSDEKIREYGMRTSPVQCGGYVPIDNAKEVMCKLCIRGNPNSKKMAEDFDYSKLKQIAIRLEKKRILDSIRYLDVNYKRKRIALTSEYKERCEEDFTEL